MDKLFNRNLSEQEIADQSKNNKLIFALSPLISWVILGILTGLAYSSRGSIFDVVLILLYVGFACSLYSLIVLIVFCFKKDKKNFGWVILGCLPCIVQLVYFFYLVFVGFSF